MNLRGNYNNTFGSGDNSARTGLLKPAQWKFNTAGQASCKNSLLSNYGWRYAGSRDTAESVDCLPVQQWEWPGCEAFIRRLQLLKELEKLMPDNYFSLGRADKGLTDQYFNQPAEFINSHMGLWYWCGGTESMRESLEPDDYVISVWERPENRVDSIQQFLDRGELHLGHAVHGQMWKMVQGDICSLGNAKYLHLLCRCLLKGCTDCMVEYANYILKAMRNRRFLRAYNEQLKEHMGYEKVIAHIYAQRLQPMPANIHDGSCKRLYKMANLIDEDFMNRLKYLFRQLYVTAAELGNERAQHALQRVAESHNEGPKA